MKIVSGRIRSREPIASALGWLATVKALPPVGRPTSLTLTRRGGEGVERRGDGSGGRRDELVHSIPRDLYSHNTHSYH